MSKLLWLMWLVTLPGLAQNSYEVTIKATELLIEGQVRGSQLTLPPGAAWRVSGMETETRGQWKAVSGYHNWKVSGHFRYRYTLPADEPIFTTCFAELLALPPEADQFRVRIVSASANRFTSVLRPVTTDTYEGDEQTGEALCAVGPMSLEEHGEVKLAYLPGRLSITDSQLNQWVSDSAEAVARYFGRFPVDRVLLVVKPGDGDEISGVTFGEGGAGVILVVPARFSLRQVLDAWQLTHELVHLSVPNLPSRHHWLEEGLATYLEPLVRGLPASKVWGDLRAGLPRGLPQADGPGLDDDSSWASTYWGGALFCLLADVELRRHSGNAHSLQEAMRAVVAEGGNVTRDWTLARFLESADRPSGSTTLRDLHQRFGPKPAAVDLNSLWRDLGVPGEPAPLDYVRKGISGE